MQGTAKREDWKSQYRELLQELETKERDWHALDAALRGVASRLAITAMGRDETVDQRLDEILDSIKAKAGEGALRRHIEDLSAAVASHEKHLADGTEIDLSGFVASLELPRAAQLRFIEGLEEGAVATQVQTLRELAHELNNLIDTHGDAADDQSESLTVITSLLTRLSRHGGEVPVLSSAVTNLKHQLRTGEGKGRQDEMLESVSSTIAQIISTIDRDKNDLESFLEQVTEQLAQFESLTSWQEGEVRQRFADGDALGKNVEQQVDELQTDIAESTELTDLKARVQVRLNAIADQLHVFREREANRQSEAELHNATLKQEINRLKVRTTALARQCNDQQGRLMFDTLTGVHTRYAYDRRLQEEFQRSQRHNRPLCFTIWDIDNFKTINDNCGHLIGDHLLKTVAAMLSKETRIEDFVARIGGDEFVVLLPSTELETAIALTNRVREHIATTDFRHDGETIKVTVSCGLTIFRDGDTPKDAYERADVALYKAKGQGRNACVAL